MSIIWNDEQKAIFAEVTSTNDNLLIEALAGAAKTSTLTALAKLLSGSTLAIAFNKKIADEMKERMPATVECRTLNGLGHRIWQSKLNKKLTLNDSKCHFALLDYIDRQEDDIKEALFETLGDLKNAISSAKNHGHIPDVIAEALGDRCSPILNDEQFFEMFPEEFLPYQRDAILHVLTTSATQALNGVIDFADQLLMPTTMRCLFPQFKNILVDEAQDLSELNHRMLERLVKSNRLIAVGDSCQAIYAFRGAHRQGMPLLADRFKMRTLHLSTTFRCPEAICDHVRWHVPRIKHWENNPRGKGEVIVAGEWDFSMIPDGAAIICRNNGPLFRCAIRMLKAGRRPNVWGRDVAAGLLKIMEGLGAPNTSRSNAKLALDKYTREKKAKLKKQSAKDALDERCQCVSVFLDDADSLGGAITLAKTVFNSQGKVDLCSGHKSKGSEWDEVFCLDRELLDMEDEQDMNLAYVIATRAKRSLTYIGTDTFSELAGAVE